MKYARHRPALSESVALIDTVETFIDQTRRPAEPEDADEAGARTNGRAQQEVTA